MKLKSLFILVFISFSSVLAATDIAGGAFDITLSKHGRTDVGLCTTATASTTHIPITSIDFDNIGTGDYQSKSDFGVYWNIYTAEKGSTASVSLEFSSANDGSHPFMLVSNENGVRSILNYNVEVNITDTSNGNTVSSTDNITVNNSEITAPMSTSRELSLVPETALGEYAEITGYATVYLTLISPEIINDDGTSGGHESFQGGVYTGYVILNFTMV